jgi:hypothetical protein
MEPNDPLSFSQEPTIGPCHEPYVCSPLPSLGWEHAEAHQTRPVIQTDSERQSKRSSTSSRGNSLASDISHHAGVFDCSNYSHTAAKKKCMPLLGLFLTEMKLGVKTRHIICCET